MGLLILGTALSWQETKKLANYVRKAGIQQFIHMYTANRNITSVALVWGDEVEYSAVYFDHGRNEVRVALVASELLPSLEGKGGFLWSPEFGDYMIEGIPGEPFSASLDQLLLVESSLRNRRRCLSEALSAVSPNIVPLTIVVFPRLGCRNFTEPTKLPNREFGTSFFIPEDLINQHQRFRTIEVNIRERRRERPAINIPMYIDSNTDSEHFSGQDLRQSEFYNPAKKGQIYMDHMGFGMCNCCLQMTYQAANIDQARYMYDQLAIIGPLMIALTNSSPLFHGFVSDLDCRWPVIEQSVDDRTHQERTDGTPGYIPNSRFSVIDCYLASESYNDIPVAIHQESYDALIQAGVDSLLSRHISHLFMRDPLLLYSHTLDEDNSTSSIHFDNFNSSNWNNVRFKPPVNSQIGWRVEFRPIDLQLTDFENAAFMIFTNLLLRVFLQDNINLYIPISQLQENFNRSYQRDSCRSQEFYFRSNIFTPLTPHDTTSSEQWDIDTIINGKSGVFCGLLHLVREYLDKTADLSREQKISIGRYLDLIRDKARGQLMTGANWIREFVMSHPSYKHDSVVCEQICYDLMVSINDLSRVSSPRLTGQLLQPVDFFLMEDEL